MLISYTWLSSYMQNPEKMPTPEKVADLFTMRAFEVESVEEKDGDTIYDIKLTADRSPYAYGIRYVALELSLLVPELIFDQKYVPFTKTTIDISHVKTEVNTDLVQAHAENSCSMYSLTKIENVYNTASPEWVVKKLRALGQQSRGTVVDLTNLVMYDTGQPLHAFDADKVEGNIHVSVIENETDVTILGGKKVSLKKGTLVIKDDKDILAIAGVKGCVKAEVTENTKNIYLESASFDRVVIRKTSRTLDIINDSSKRFEQGVSPERFLLAVQTYIGHIQDLISEAHVHTTQISHDMTPIFSSQDLTRIQVHVTRAIQLIDNSNSGLREKFTNFLEHVLIKTGADVEKKDEDTYHITAPLYRTDLQTEADVIDEFMRNVGYEIISYVPTPKSESDCQEKKYTALKAVRKHLTEKGFTEVLLHTLVDSKKNPDAVLLENALTSERDALRAKLSPEIANAIQKNFPYLDIVEKKSVDLFEIGYVYEVESVGDKKQIKQKLHLALGTGMPKWPKKTADTFSHTEIMQELYSFLGWTQDKDSQTLPVNTEKTIFVTEVNITDLINVSVVEDENEGDQNYLSPNARIKLFPYKKASMYPSMSRDIAFFVEGSDKEVVDQAMRDIIKKYPLIETVTLFDVFTKEDKTSYGYRFVFQSYEKTLTEEEVSGVMLDIASVVTEKGWSVR